MHDLIREDPPEPRTPARNWAAIMLHVSEEAPGEWVIVAHDVPTSITAHLKRGYAVEARVKGVGSKPNRAEKLYVRWIPGTSRLTERAEKIRDRRDAARAARARLDAKQSAREAAE